MESKEALENNKKYKMTGKDAFLALGSCILAKNKHYRDNDINLLCGNTNEMISPQRAAGLVLEELDRLEKYDKAKELIKKKKVDEIDILYISQRYVKELWTLVYNKRHPNELTQEEFDFILEVFR